MHGHHIQRNVMPPVVAILLLGTLGERCPGEPAVPPATVCGRLVTIEGQPIAGKISIRPPYSSVYTTDAGADGNFRLTLKPEEVVRTYGWLGPNGLVAEAKGFAPTVISLPVLPAGGEVRLGDVYLEPGTRVYGRVLSPEGTPVVGARITVTAWVHTSESLVEAILPESTLVTDVQGAFETSALPCCQPTLEISAPGYQLAAVPLQLDGWAQRVELQPIRLQREFPVHGYVRDPDDKPVVGASINYGGGRTDAEGFFQLHGLWQDYSLQLIVSANGYRPHNKLHRGESQIDIVLQRVHYLTGRVTDARTRKSIRLKQVVLCEYSLDTNGQPRVDGCRNARLQQPEPGGFMIEHFGPARYHLLFKAGGYHDRELFLNPLDSDRDWELGGIELQPLDRAPDEALVVQRLRGTIVRCGHPVSGATVSLWTPGRALAARGSAPVYYGRLVPPRASCHEMRLSGEGGRFEFRVPYQGDWLLRVDISGKAPTVVGPVSVKRGEDTQQDIELGESGSLAGQVEGAQFSPPGVLWAIVFDGRAIIEVAHVDPAGQFRFDQLPVGRYGVKIGHCAMKDPEIYGTARDRTDDPWNRAEKVEVVAGGQATAKLDARYP